MTFLHPNVTFWDPEVTSWYPKSLSGTRTSLQQPSMCTGRAPLAYTHEAAPTPGYNQPRTVASPHPWWPGQDGLPAASPSLRVHPDLTPQPLQEEAGGNRSRWATEPSPTQPQPHTTPAGGEQEEVAARSAGRSSGYLFIGAFIYGKPFADPTGVEVLEEARLRVSQPAKLSFPAGWEAQGCAPRPGPPCGPAAGNAAPSPAAWPGFKRSPASRFGEKVVFGCFFFSVSLALPSPCSPLP